MIRHKKAQADEAQVESGIVRESTSGPRALQLHLSLAFHSIHLLGIEKMTPAKWMLLLSFISWSVLVQEVNAGIPRLRPLTSGVYHQDRWGVGRICSNGSYDHIAPSLHERLKQYEGKRITIEVKDFVAPGVAFSSHGRKDYLCITEIGKITELPASKLKIDLRAWPNPEYTGTYKQSCFLVKLINEGDKPLVISLRSLMIWHDYPSRVEDGETSDWFRVYTQGQMSIERQQGMQGWGPGRGHSPIRASDTRGVIPIGTSLKILPGQEFPVVPSPIVIGKAHEITVRLLGYENTPTAISWFPMDKIETPVETGEDRKLKIKDVEVRESTKTDFLLRFRLHTVGEEQRSVVAKSSSTPNWGKHSAIAGRLFAIDENDRTLSIYPKGWNLDDCPLELTKVPVEGLLVALSIKGPLTKRYRFDVLTGSGLETVWFDRPDEIGPKLEPKYRPGIPPGENPFGF